MVICPSIGARNHANKWYFRVPKQALDPFFSFLFFRSLNNHFHSKVIGGEKGALNLQKDILKLTILAKRLTKSFSHISHTFVYHIEQRDYRSSRLVRCTKALPLAQWVQKA